MYHPKQPSSSRDRHHVGILAGMAISLGLAQVVLGASSEPAATMSGQQVYNNVCVACHSPPGFGGAPALGDEDAWAPRIAKGMDTLIDHALNGFSGSTGVMPRKGERVDLSDEEVIEAVEYMVGRVSQ